MVTIAPATSVAASLLSSIGFLTPLSPPPLFPIWFPSPFPRFSSFFPLPFFLLCSPFFLLLSDFARAGDHFSALHSRRLFTYPQRLLPLQPLLLIFVLFHFLLVLLLDLRWGRLRSASMRRRRFFLRYSFGAVAFNQNRRRQSQNSAFRQNRRRRRITRQCGFFRYWTLFSSDFVHRFCQTACVDLRFAFCPRRNVIPSRTMI